ncbi:MAG: prephenate dehydrogenase [Candidatus Hydrogenedentes bacterium]|nr:prephenate dehydrogenase [Candidatus Hydrogenedentota bacterium]
MTQRYGAVTIIGVGLLGGSLALALKAKNLTDTVRGVGRNPATLEKAKALGIIDSSYLEPVEACRGADLIAICTPAGSVPSILDGIRPACSNSALVTDVASTKAVICSHAARTWPAPLRFVGSHPMAGSEKFGPQHASPTLYEGCITIVDQSPAAAEARKEVTALWEALGAKVLPIDPESHDALVARTSHIPHIAAGCIARLAAAAGEVTPFVGPGFRDVTRVAAGRPELWRDICLTNRTAIMEGLEQLEEDLAYVRRMVAEGHADGLDAFFEQAQEARRKALGGS